MPHSMCDPRKWLAYQSCLTHFLVFWALCIICTLSHRTASLEAIQIYSYAQAQETDCVARVQSRNCFCEAVSSDVFNALLPYFTEKGHF